MEVLPMTEPAKKTRVTIYVQPEIRRRLRMAAARSDLSLGEYVLDAVRTRLDADVPPEDDLLKAAETGLAFWDNPVDDEVWNGA